MRKLLILIAIVILGLGITSAQSLSLLKRANTQDIQGAEREIQELGGHEEYAVQKAEELKQGIAVKREEIKQDLSEYEHYMVKASEIGAAKEAKQRSLVLLIRDGEKIDAAIKEAGIVVEEPRSDFLQVVESYGIQPLYGQAMLDVVRWYGEQTGKYIKPEYLMTLGLNENMRNRRAVGDSGCSFGAFQINMCAGSGRWHMVWHGMTAKQCALDAHCSMKWTIERLESVYKCNILDDGTITNWNQCLSKHQGAYPDGRYVEKTGKNGRALGL